MKDFVPYEQTIEIMNLGFNGPYVGWYWNLFDGWPQDEDAKWVLEDRYNNDSRWHEKAITYSQAFRWFREKYGYLPFIDMDNYSYYRFNIYKGSGISEAPFETYEEAEIACLNKLIEIVKTKQNE